MTIAPKAPWAALTSVPNRKTRRSDRMRARRGAMGVYIAATMPVMIMIGSLGFDQAYVSAKRNQLQATTQAAALAGAGNLASYYAATGTSSSNSTTAISNAATYIAGQNMPSTPYGNVVSSSTVTVGTWTASTKSFAAGGTYPNAVKVEGNMTSGNGNALSVPFGGMFGLGSVNMSSSVVALASGSHTTSVTSSGSGANQFNIILLNDISQSFSPELSNMKAGDTSIVDCLSSASSVGLTTFDGTATVQQPITALSSSSNLTTVKNAISALGSCGTSGMPSCSGSNVAGGLYGAISQYNTSAYNPATHTGISNNIVIFTDGDPNENSGVTYGKLQGTYTTGNDGSYDQGASGNMSSTTLHTSSGTWMTALGTTQTCSGSGTSGTGGVGSGCSDSNLLTMATNQASIARGQGINVWVVYYTGDSGSSASTYATDLKALASTSTASGSKLFFAPNTAADLQQAVVSVCAASGASVAMASH